MRRALLQMLNLSVIVVGVLAGAMVLGAIVVHVLNGGGV
jgi:hypothetical protein